MKTLKEKINILPWHSEQGYEQIIDILEDIESRLSCSEQEIVIPFKKLHHNAVEPTKAYPDDAGWDLTAVNREFWGNTNGIGNHTVIYHTGIAFSIPPGWEGQLRARSSNRKNMMLHCNAPSTIDANYIGGIQVSFKIVGEGRIPDVGEKICQIVFKRVPAVRLEQVDELTPSARGDKGHGSSGL